MKKVLRITALLVVAFLSVGAQSNDAQNGILKMSKQFRSKSREQIVVPDVLGYQVLKCDFHIHTVFSDGMVWPLVRLQEAWQEGLDAFSLTEHIEYSPLKPDVSQDKNRPHEIIAEDAAQMNVMAIRGAEITRSTPPGHFNALFLQDNNALITDGSSELDYEAVKAASKQDAFIFWNHPGWRRKIKGSYEWIDFVDQIHKEGMLHGIEVMNGSKIYLKALDWCIEHNLTVMGTSDVHNLSEFEYDFSRPYIHRTMTLVMAKERTPEAIKEALMAGRTVAWSSKYLAGKKEYLMPLVEECIKVQPSHYSSETDGKTIRYYELVNNSSIVFELSLKEGEGTRHIKLLPLSSQTIQADGSQTQLTYTCENTFIRSDEQLEITLRLQL